MKIIKIVGIVIVSLLAMLFVLPYLFRDKVKDAVETAANEMLEADVSLSDFSLGFFSNFPNATLSMDSVCVVGVDTFAGDTLLSVRKLNVAFDLSSLFSDSYVVRKIELIDPTANAIVLSDGTANWNIMAEDTTAVEEEASSSPLRLNLSKVSVQNLKVSYNSEQDSMFAMVEGVDLDLKGDLALDIETLADIDVLKLVVDKIVYENNSSSTMKAELEKVDLDFKGKMKGNRSDLKLLLSVDSSSVSMGGIPYLSKAKLNTDIAMVADLDSNKFSFADNYIRLNEIQANFVGYVHLVDSTTTDMDLALNTPDIDFKQILSLVPAIYAKEFASIQTSGKVALNAVAKGSMVGDTIPMIDASLKVSDAMFKYPDLPSDVKNINIEAFITNPGGATDLTEVNVPKFSFNMAGNPFTVTLGLKTPVSDPDFKVTADGTINLGTLKQVIYLDNMDLNGVLTAALKAQGKMSYVDQERYELFNVDGKLKLSDFLMKSKSLNYDVKVNDAQLGFTSQHVDLDAQVGVGKSDLSLKGKLQNFIQYAMRGETLKGSLAVNSKLIDTNELLGDSSEEAPSTTSEGASGTVSIPANVEFDLNVAVDHLQYDAIKLMNLNCAMNVKDAVANIKKLSAQSMGGTVAVNGLFDTKDTLHPHVDVNMDVQNMSVSEVFSNVRTAKKLVPMLSDAEGNFSVAMKFASNMDATLSPILNTVNAKGNFTSKEIALKNVKVMNELAEKVNFTALKDPRVKNLSLSFAIKDGRLYADPFETAISSAIMNLTGSSGLDQTLDYTAKITLPKSVAKDVNLGFDVLVGGSFAKPTIKVSVASVLNEIKEKVTEKIDEAKEKAIAEAKAQKEKLIKEATEQKDKIIATAKSTAEKALKKAQAQSDSIVAKANNPIAKAAAKKTGDALVKKAKTESDKVIKDAETQGNKLVKDAETKGDALVKKASEAGPTK